MMRGGIAALFVHETTEFNEAEVNFNPCYLGTGPVFPTIEFEDV